MRTTDLQPDEQREIVMDLIAVGSTGWMALPKIAVWEENGDGSQGTKIRVMDGRSGEVVDGEGVQVFVRP